MRTAVVGHVEWVECLLVDHAPQPGEIVHSESTFEIPAGGGSVAAVQLARLAGDCTFFTAVGDDELGRRAVRELEALGVRVEAAIVAGKATRRGFAFLDTGHERTITTIGERLAPTPVDSDLPWHELADVAGVYFVAGDSDALRAARAARAVVTTARISTLLERAHVPLDAVVGSAHDAAERYRALDPPPRYVAITDGARGGGWTAADGHSGRWQSAQLPGPPVDAYGCGDSFAAGLAFALGAGHEIDAALSIAARCGATCMTGRGPYGRQLTPAEL